MDDYLVRVISPVVGLLGGLIISATGLALGGAARYGLPVTYRPVGGRILAALGSILMLILVASAVAEGPGGRFGLAVFFWLHGFQVLSRPVSAPIAGFCWGQFRPAYCYPT